jgi:hypothetical protein
VCRTGSTRRDTRLGESASIRQRLPVCWAIVVQFASARDLVEAYGTGSPLAAHLAGVDDAARQALVAETESALSPWTSDTGLSFPIEALLLATTP